MEVSKRGLITIAVGIALVAAIFLIAHTLSKPKPEVLPAGTTAVVVVTEYTDGSADCLKQDAVLDGLAKKYAGEVRFEKIDASTNPDKVAQNHITRFPSVVVAKVYTNLRSSSQDLAMNLQISARSEGLASARTIRKNIEFAQAVRMKFD